MSHFREKLKSLRRDYSTKPLDERSVSVNPFEQFVTWLDQAIACEQVVEPNAFVLATVSNAGAPSQRTVLLKDLTTEGFVFFSNYESQKGREGLTNPSAAALFLWPALERQIRIEGVLSKTSAEGSDRYFQSRPLEAQIAATISPQSSKITRDDLEQRFNRAILSAQENLSCGIKVQRPAYWGGFVLKPIRFEFWQGRASRLHDRIIYKSSDTGQKWKLERLAP
jgi:pyridoxamine 5'-phosphate oxidase